jgi:type VI protein secretion system component Hcp
MAKASQYLKIVDQNGNLVEGECLADRHEKEIDLTGWNWELEDPAAPKMGSTDDAQPDGKSKAKPKIESERDTKPKPSKFNFSKNTDRSTTRLLNALDRGEIFPKAILTIEEKFEASPLPFYMEVEFRDVFVLDFGWRANAERAGISFDEDWVLNYSEIRFKYLWRGKPPGWFDARFDRKADATDEPAKKAPLTKAEEDANFQAKLKEFQKKNPTK